jgi:pimeloyl-ACP methyl ester carboxylesterase
VGRATTLPAQRRLVTGLLEQLGPQLLVGNSMGGTIGIWVAAARPELVPGLVLLNPAVPHPRPGVADWARIAWLAPLAVPALGAGIVAMRARALGPERLVDTSLAASLARVDALDPGLRDRMVALTAERLRWPEPAPAYAAAARSLVGYLARGLHRDLAVAAARCPILLVHGSEDRLVPLEAATHAARLHSLPFVVLDGMGHAPQLEDPDRVVDAVAPWIADTVEDAAPARSHG